MAQINVGIIGFGTVGAGAVELLLKNAETIAARVGAPVVIRKIADLDIESDRGVAVEPGLLTTDAMDVIDDPAIDMVVELVGGLDKAREFMLMAMEKGKHVVTANKALLAEYGRDIYASARRLGVHLGFEASVGGGIPILGALAGGLAANRIQTMVGILNGTSNYILTKMTREGLAYEKAVEEAVRLGFAEDPPTLDVNGTDAAHKLAILLSVASGVPMDFRSLYREGIEGLSPDSIRRRFRVPDQAPGHCQAGKRMDRGKGASRHDPEGSYPGQRERGIQRHLSGGGLCRTEPLLWSRSGKTSYRQRRGL